MKRRETAVTSAADNNTDAAGDNADRGQSSDDEDDLPNVWCLPQHHADEVELRQVSTGQFIKIPTMRFLAEFPDVLRQHLIHFY